MRIVGGTFRSRVLSDFDGDKIRPTSDKVRESLFNILNGKVYSKRVLDLFCGTGAIGIEAISRGAGLVTFNDFSLDSLALLKKNLARLKIDGGYEITNLDGVAFLEKVSARYDIIYIDPPYKTDLGRRALDRVSFSLNDGGVAVFEDEKPFDGEVKGLKIVKEKKYGRVYLTFFEKE